MTAKTRKKQGGRPFPKGVSGNPKGRPQGSRNKATIACQNLLDGQAQALTSKAVEMALDGDMTALRLCIDRLIPTRKDSPIKFTLPAVDTPADLSQATSAVALAVANGALTPSEGDLVSKTLDRHAKALELTEIEERLQALEGRV